MLEHLANRGKYYGCLVNFISRKNVIFFIDHGAHYIRINRDLSHTRLGEITWLSYVSAPSYRLDILSSITQTRI